MSLAQAIREKAIELGFHAVEFVPAQRLPHADAHYEWIREGRHGLMAWIERHGELRADPTVLEPGTRTVIALMTNYHAGSDTLPGGLRVARYAHGDDYHDVLRARMLTLAAFVHAETGADVGSRPAVDSAPLLERDLAAAAGLGWGAKNTMLIRQGLGSYTLLSELLVNIEIGDAAAPAADRCGTCSRCLDACPTGAIVSPYVVDARRCIAYLTIELRGPIPRALRPKINDHVFGCDLCQDVCPWNRRAPRTEDPAFMVREALKGLSLVDLLRFDQDTFSRVFAKSAVKRAKRAGLLRNAAIVLGNRRRADELPALLERLMDEGDPLVRGHVAWAVGRFLAMELSESVRENAHAGLEAALASERDVFVRDELLTALDFT